MEIDLLFRFIAGGLIVSGFAVLGDILRPNLFAGIFGAAPSVALASLGSGFISGAMREMSIEARSMVLGAVALACYCGIVRLLVVRSEVDVRLATGGAVLVWLALALGLKSVFL